MFLPASCPAALLPKFIAADPIWWIAALIVVFGLLIFGREELRRLSPSRIWAISSVCFAESLRRRVLWVTPLAIIGVIVVTELQHAADPQEAMQQATRFCLFASGLLVVVTAVILTCTNLPREIENRVIFTIVTKPTTRLEIVLGKLVGFIRMSGLIVVLMGIFTCAYLFLRDRALTSQLAERLQVETDPSTRQILLGYQTAGLLSTKSLDDPVDLQIFEHEPSASGVQWLTGYYGFTYILPFEPDASQRALMEAAATDPEHGQVLIVSTMKLRRNVPTAADMAWITNRHLPMESQAMGPVFPGAKQTAARPIPQLNVRILDENLAVLVPETQINGGKMTSAELGHPVGPDTYVFPTGLSAQIVRVLLEHPRFFVQVIPETNSVEYQVSEMPTVLDVVNASGENAIRPAPDPTNGGAPTRPRFLSQAGRYGMKVVGGPNGEGSVAVFRFTHATVPAAKNGTAVFRFRGGLDHSGDYVSSQPWSIVTMNVINRDTHESSGPIEFHPETNQNCPIAVPAKYLTGGNFDVHVTSQEAGLYVGIYQNSLQLISAEHSFVLNLLESLLILWLMSILVVVIAIFTSTFLSWPIAVVLTLILLLGHWGVVELGDALNPGVGRSVATDLGFGEAADTKVVSASVDALAKMLTTVSNVLPDLSKFPVMDDISRGVSIPARSLLDALGVLACYGLPLLVLSFVILKNKEVAP